MRVLWRERTASSLFGSGSLVWGLAGQLTQPLFNGGLRAAEAEIDAAAANYRQTVLQALRNVADVLRALDNDAQALAAYAAADASAQESLQLVQRQHALGAASYLQWLVAQQQAQQTRISLIASQRPSAWPIPPRCSRPWEASGGVTKLTWQARHSDLRYRVEPPFRRTRTKQKPPSRWLLFWMEPMSLKSQAWHLPGPIMPPVRRLISLLDVPDSSRAGELRDG